MVVELDGFSRFSATRTGGGGQDQEGTYTDPQSVEPIAVVRVLPSPKRQLEWALPGRPLDARFLALSAVPRAVFPGEV